MKIKRIDCDEMLRLADPNEVVGKIAECHADFSNDLALWQQWQDGFAIRQQPRVGQQMLGQSCDGIQAWHQTSGCFPLCVIPAQSGNQT
jgi:hypothetical protein